MTTLRCSQGSVDIDVLNRRVLPYWSYYTMMKCEDPAHIGLPDGHGFPNSDILLQKDSLKNFASVGTRIDESFIAI